MNTWIQKSVLALLFCVGFSAYAEVETSGSIIHSADQIFRENLNIVAGSFETEAIYNRDVSILGKEIFMNGYIEGDLLVGGREVNILGEVDGDVRSIGGIVKLQGIVEGDILVFGGKVIIAEDALIYGDAILMGGELEQFGYIQGETKIISGNVLLDGEQRGDTAVTTQNMSVGENARFQEGFEYVYFAPRQTDFPEQSQGVFEYNRTNSWYNNTSLQSNTSIFFGFWSLLKFVTNSVLIFLLYFLFRGFSEKVRMKGSIHWLRGGLIGLVALFAIPTGAILLMVSLIGLPIGVILLLFFWLLLILRTGLASLILGRWVMILWNRYSQKKVKENQKNIVLWSIIALALMSAIKYIPYFGNIFISLLALISLGTALHVIYNMIINRR